MAKNIMCIIRFRNLLNKISFKTSLLTFIAVVFLSACGVKGDLYQTPDEPVLDGTLSESELNEATLKKTDDQVGSQKQSVTTQDESVSPQIEQESAQTATKNLKEHSKEQ